MTSKSHFASASSKSVSRSQDANGSARTLSVRLSLEERLRLEREAAGQALSSYARQRLFDRRARRNVLVSDHQALTRVLSALGRSPQIGTLKGILAACDDGTLVMGPEAEEALRVACTNITTMRQDLIAALGLKPE